MLKNFPFERQKKIVFREGIFSFIVAVFFQFFGEIFLRTLQISDYALTITGGSLLFIVALQMIFPLSDEKENVEALKEPYIVPIATPLISGPGLMTMIMITSRQEQNDLNIFLAISLAWVGVMAVLVCAPYLQKILGKRGLAALQQVMGMVLGLISMQMLVNGLIKFIKTL